MDYNRPIKLSHNSLQFYIADKKDGLESQLDSVQLKPMAHVNY